MAKFKTWVKAARPRTVLLSFSGVLLGGFLAARLAINGEFFYPFPILFAAITAVLLQILSNLANDYGDFKKGTVIVSGLCLLSGFLLLFVYYVAQVAIVPHYRFLFVLSFFIALGIGAILAALFYTLGKRPYGYRGLGDLFCFLFFGWAAVAGTYYLSAPWFDFSVLLPATAMGFLSNAVLNINNMRDYENDKASGKNSLVVKLGLKKAFVYHCLLIIGAFVCLAVYLVLHHAAWYSYLFVVLFLFFLKDLIAIKTTKPEQLDPFLGRQVKHSFLLVVVYGILMLV